MLYLRVTCVRAAVTCPLYRCRYNTHTHPSTIDNNTPHGIDSLPFLNWNGGAWIGELKTEEETATQDLADRQVERVQVRK